MKTLLQKQISKIDEQKICFRCYQNIYHLEIFGPILGQFYHKTCFRCVYCDRYLDLKTFKTNTFDLSDKHVYCSSHVPKKNNQYVFCETKSNNSKVEHVQTKKLDENKKLSNADNIESISAKIKISLMYAENKLMVSIYEALTLITNKMNNYYVDVKLMNDKSDCFVKRTKSKNDYSHPVWNEVIDFEIANNDVSSQGLLINLNSISDSSEDDIKVIGKVEINLGTIDLTKGGVTKWYHMINMV